MSLSAMSQEEIVTKIYRDMARLASEISIARCRNRVLLTLVKEKLGTSDEELNELFRAELQENLEQYVRDITGPMVTELLEAEEVGPVTEMAAGCGGGCACH